MYDPAGKVLVVGCGFALRSWLGRGSCSCALGPLPLPPASVVVVTGRGGVRLPGIVTVNSAVAREISTPCFRSTFSRFACAPGCASSAGSTYAAGPSVRALRTDRLLLR